MTTARFTPGSIVVGVDGSPLSAAAVEWAARRAAARGLALHIVHACRSDPGVGFGPPVDADASRAAGQALLARSVARAHTAAPGLEISTSCVPGFASKTLVQVSHKAAMVVIGAIGNGIVSRASIGPTTLRVAMAAHCPVVVIGHEGRTDVATHGKVVVGVDGSPASLTALNEAFDRAALRGAELEIVHAWQAKRAGHDADGAQAHWPQQEHELEEAVAAHVSARAASHPDIAVAHNIVRADPVSALGAQSKSADLVIIGRRGVGGFPGLRLGSVAVGLMGKTACPLVIAPMPAA